MGNNDWTFDVPEEGSDRNGDADLRAAQAFREAQEIEKANKQAEDEKHKG